MFDPYAKPKSRFHRFAKKWVESFVTSIFAVFLLCCLLALLGVLGFVLTLAFIVLFVAIPISALVALGMGIAGVFKWEDW